MCCLSGQTRQYLYPAFFLSFQQWIKGLYPKDENLAFENTLKVLTSFMMGAGTIVMALYWYVMDVSKAQQQKAKALLARSSGNASTSKEKKAKPRYVPYGIC